jgi:hypothetical protein
MAVDEARLVGILRIGHDTSMRGEGISLRDALMRSGYDQFRKEFRPSDLVPLLRASPDYMKQWIMYCEDKRTRGGFWVREDSFEVGSLDSPDATVRYDSLEVAIAEFVVRELDYWSQVSRRTRRLN